MKNSVVISNPHATLSQQGNLESPSGSGVLSSGSSSPLYSKNVDSTQSPLASSPSSAHSGPSNSLTWGTNASSSSAVSKDGLGFQSVSSLHTSCESIDISLGSGGALSHNSSTGLIAASKDDALTPFVRTNSVKTTLSERLVLCVWLPLSPRKTPLRESRHYVRKPRCCLPLLGDFSLSDHCCLSRGKPVWVGVSRALLPVIFLTVVTLSAWSCCKSPGGRFHASVLKWHSTCEILPFYPVCSSPASFPALVMVRAESVAAASMECVVGCSLST